MSKFAAIVLSYNRPLNMPLVIQGLESQSFIDDIIIIHNSPESPQFPKHKNIVSDINLGCAIRHSIASLLSGYDYFVFIDDDLYLNRDLSDKIKLSVSMCGKKAYLDYSDWI
jgi:glycosyltransferase involved in cell wall biosynthesis